jgi:Ca2+-binding EF-hand superfamily protein
MSGLSKDEKKAQMKRNFGKLDANGDGTLDFSELKTLLKQGNPTFTEDECRTLYNKCDSNNDGKISFDEFLNYIYRASKTGAGRHALDSMNSAVEDDGTEMPWGTCLQSFENFAGKDMDNREWAKFCKDLGLINKQYTKTDVDIIFSKVVPKGQRRMDFQMFIIAVRHIAKKRGQTNRQIQDMVANANGPKFEGTELEKCRFYDDKSTYTGTATYNDKFAGVDPTAAHGRHEKMSAANESMKAGNEDEEDDWSECERVFRLFAGAEGLLDNTEFSRMCQNISGLMRGNFTQPDIDNIFAECKSNKQSRGIDFKDFKACVRMIAGRKDENVYVTQATVARSKGPQQNNVTKAEYNKFHDDKSLYTGTHAEQW